MTLGELRRTDPIGYSTLTRSPFVRSWTTDAVQCTPPTRTRRPSFWAFGRKHSVAADAMRMYQDKHRSNPNYTLKQAWKDVRKLRKRGDRFGFGAEARSEFGADATSNRSEFGAVAANDRFGFGAEAASDRFAIGAERSSDLSFGEDEHSFGAKVAFGRPSFGRPQLTL